MERKNVKPILLRLAMFLGGWRRRTPKTNAQGLTQHKAFVLALMRDRQRRPG
jgi:hypothetical protein